MLGVKEYNRQLEARKTCPDCPMRNKGVFVGVDSVSGLVEPQTVMFMGLNPGNEEARIGLPFVGPSGRFLRSQIAKAKIASWVMANSLLCSTANESEITDGKKARKACHGNLSAIFKSFLPPLIVPCGNGAWSIFESGIGITEASTRFFLSCGPAGKSRPTLILPMLHPSALIRAGGEHSPRYLQFFERLSTIHKLETLINAAGLKDALERLKGEGKRIEPCFAR